jgi:hypothetical protein
MQSRFLRGSIRLGGKTLDSEALGGQNFFSGAAPQAAVGWFITAAPLQVAECAARYTSLAPNNKTLVGAQWAGDSRCQRAAVADVSSPRFREWGAEHMALGMSSVYLRYWYKRTYTVAALQGVGR